MPPARPASSAPPTRRQAFLQLNGYASAVITEDSDLLVFGVTDVMYKFDGSATGKRVQLKDVFEKVTVSGRGAKGTVKLSGWTQVGPSPQCVRVGGS